MRTTTTFGRRTRKYIMIEYIMIEYKSKGSKLNCATACDYATQTYVEACRALKCRVLQLQQKEEE